MKSVSSPLSKTDGHPWTNPMKSGPSQSDAMKMELSQVENKNPNEQQVASSVDQPLQTPTSGKSTAFKVFMAVVGTLIGACALAGVGIGIFTLTQTSTTTTTSTSMIIVPMFESFYSVIVESLTM